MGTQQTERFGRSSIKFARRVVVLAALTLLVAGVAVGNGVLTTLPWGDGPDDTRELVVSRDSDAGHEWDDGKVSIGRLFVDTGPEWSFSAPEWRFVATDTFNVDRENQTIEVDGSPMDDWRVAVVIERPNRSPALMLTEDRSMITFDLDGPNGTKAEHTLIFSRVSQIYAAWVDCPVVVDHDGAIEPKVQTARFPIHLGAGQSVTLHYVEDDARPTCPRATLEFEPFGTWDRPD